MNKTVTINLGGLVFYIDENAYAELSAYINLLKEHFSANESCEEIISDIELRLAEIFKDKIHAHKQVVNSKDVEDAIAILGKPEDIGESETTSSENGAEPTSKSQKRRLYRDPDDRILGGVCSGLGQYFDLDPVWFRIGFVAAFFVLMSGPFLYLIAWFIIPLAQTTAQKMEMKGGRFNLSDIENNVKKEYHDIKSRFQGYRQKNRKRTENYNTSESTSKLSGFFEEIFHYGFRAILLVVGMVSLAFGLALLLGFIMSITASQTLFFSSGLGYQYFSLPYILNIIIPNDSLTNLALISLCLLVGIPIIGILWGGIKLLFGLKLRNKALSYVTGILWFSGMLLCAYVCVQTLLDFRESTTGRNRIEISNPENGILYIQLNENFASASKENDISVHGWNAIISEHSKSAYVKPKVELIKSQSKNFEVHVVRSASGATYEEAKSRIAMMNLNIVQNDSILRIDEAAYIPNDIKWRKQKISIELHIPVGMAIHLDPTCENLRLSHEGNEQAFVFDYVGKVWEMTYSGLRTAKN